MPMEEKKKRVYEIIDALEMRKCINTSEFLFYQLTQYLADTISADTIFS